jgi:hypothetical protein
MLCPRCRQDLEDNSQFCIHCGQKIVSEYGQDRSKGEPSRWNTAEIAAFSDATIESGADPTNLENSGSKRGEGVGLIFAGIFWMVVSFVLNYLIYSYGINRWLGGWIGPLWGIVFLSFMLGGIFFVLIGILAVITGKVYLIK